MGLLQTLGDSEKYIEKKLVLWVKSQHGECPKWVSPGTRGVQDRLVFLPRGIFYIIELKSAGKKRMPLQVWWHNRLTELGFISKKIENLNELLAFFEEAQNRLNEVRTT